MPATASAGLARRVLHAATRVYQGLNLERRSKPLLRENALGEAGRASDRDAVREINEVQPAPIPHPSNRSDSAGKLDCISLG